MHNKNELFCSKCLIHDTFFVSGGSCSPSCCPKCKGTNCTLYENLTFVQRAKANKLFDIMWEEKFNLKEERQEMKFFYSAGAVNYGEGYWWHRFFDFPTLSFVTKTLTYYPKKGHKYFVLPVGKSVFNRVGLDNIGICKFIEKYPYSKLPRTVSIAGPDEYIHDMIILIDHYLPKKDSIELNYSCPNVKSFNNNRIPKTDRDIYLKLNRTQDPYAYNLDRVKGIRLNSIPLKFCGGSGKIAQKKNWEFIKKFNKEGLNVAGCSMLNVHDIGKLEDLGCTEIGIGSVMLTNPWFVEKIKFHDKTRKGCNGKNL